MLLKNCAEAVKFPLEKFHGFKADRNLKEIIKNLHGKMLHGNFLIFHGIKEV